MPNHVTNKVTFAVEHAEAVFSTCCPGGKLDFETLVPSPPHKYSGGLTKADEEDFPVNWSSWNRHNWGTKWNAYDCSQGVEDGKAYLKFDTAWSPPWPVMAAFCSRFNIPFEHRYWDEGENFWGIDTWSFDRWGRKEESISRTEKRYKRDEDRRALMLELTGEDWDAIRAKEAEEELAEGKPGGQS